MHLIYLEKYEPEVFATLQKGEKCEPYVKYDYYHRHFVTNYKLYFGLPRSDTCQTCDTLENQVKT